MMMQIKEVVSLGVAFVLLGCLMKYSWVVPANGNIEKLDAVEFENKPVVIEENKIVPENDNYSGQMEEITVAEELKPKIIFSDDDADLLLRIGMCEAGAESVECIAHVMRVVLNRVGSGKFPDSIRDVIYQYNQFTPVTTGWIEVIEPSGKCKEALNMIQSGWDETQGALYFECIGGDSWHSRNLEYLYQIDHVFFYK